MGKKVFPEQEVHCDRRHMWRKMRNIIIRAEERLLGVKQINI